MAKPEVRAGPVGTAVAPAKAEIKTFADLMKWAQPQMAAILPKHLTPERMVGLCHLAVAKTPKLKDCTPLSLFHAIMQASRLGLEIGTKAHLVPFKTECVMIPDYRGLIDLARRGGEVQHIDVRVVYKGDDFDFGLGDTPFIKHKPVLDGDRSEANIYCFYSVAHMKDGRKFFGEPMTKAEVDAIRKRSRAANDGPWVTDYVAMGKKTVAKRDLKWLPQTPELEAAIELDNRAETGEIGIPSDIIDSPASMNATVAEKTAEKVEELKEKMGAGSGRADPLETEQSTEVDQGGENPPATAPASTAVSTAKGKPPF